MFKDIAGKISDFLKDCVICGYNAGFDLAFLNNSFEREGATVLTNYALDVLAVARDNLNGLPAYNLKSVAAFFNIDSNFHRAYDDAAVTMKIFSGILDVLRNRGVLDAEEYLKRYLYKV